MQCVAHPPRMLSQAYKPPASCRSAGPVSNQRNLIPCERLDLPAIQFQDLEQPLKVQASAIAVPHPEKVHGGIGKAVNKKKTGWGGEDAYFCTTGP